MYNSPLTMSQQMKTQNNQSLNDRIIKSSLIIFHEKEVDESIYSSEFHFGIYTLEIDSLPMTQSDQEVLSVNDMSGSMNDLCSDGRSKMQHLQLTLENIVTLLSTNSENLNIALEITGFDDNMEEVIPKTKITNDPNQVENIHKRIKSVLRPRSGTDIGLALKKSQEKLQHIPTPTINKSLIFMTDGVITSGMTDLESLKKLTPNNSQNYFVGLGADHDYKLLQSLASINSGSFYYVDKIENAGLVFGEIIHSILYTALRNVTIRVTNGEIYDFKTNQWVTEITVPNLCSESKKNYHIRSINSSIFSLTLTGLKNDNSPFVLADDIPIPYLEDPNTGELLKDNDLTKYMFRQKVLELLHISATIAENELATSEEKTLHQEAMINLRKKIEAYSEKQQEQQENQEDKDYLKQLQDDLYISCKTLKSQNALLYTVTRQNAQGRECSYNMTQIEREDAMQDDEDDDDDKNYVLCKRGVSNAYTSNSQRQVMRGVSARGTDANIDFEEEVDKEFDAVVENYSSNIKRQSAWNATTDEE